MHKLDNKKSSLIRLDLNENPLGPSLTALKAAIQAVSTSHRYPSKQENLKNTLANHYGLTADFVLLGNGSESLLNLIATCYLNSNTQVIVPKYTFNRIIKIILTKNAQILEAENDINRLLPSQILKCIKHSTKIVFIVNPNNPTGTYITKKDLIFLLETLPKHILLVLDEAYGEYASAKDYFSSIHLIKKYSNLIVTKTFSKFYALAGFRIGYLIAQPHIITKLQQNDLPFSVNNIALAAAEAAFKDNIYQQKIFMINQIERKKMSERLIKQLLLNVIPSQTNFLCVDLSQAAYPVYLKLIKKSILVKPLDEYKLFHHLRISIGKAEENNYLLDTLLELL